MTVSSRAVSWVGLALLLGAPAVVRAQPAGIGQHVSDAAFQTSAGEQARLLRDDDGRVVAASGMEIQAIGATAEDRARNVLKEIGWVFGVEESTDLRVERVQRAHGLVAVRLRRHAFGLPVIGCAIVVRMDDAGIADLVHGRAGPAALDPSPVQGDAESVGRLARAAVPWPQAAVMQASLVGFDTGREIARAWSVELLGRSIAERALVTIDSRDGTLLFVRSLVHHARGRVYATNPVVAMGMTTDVTLDDLLDPRSLDGRYCRVRSCATTGSDCRAVENAQPDAAGDFLFDPMEPSYSDAFAEVNAYFHVDRVARYFRDAHAFEWSCCGTSSQMDVIANYVEIPTVPYENAFYSTSSCGREFCGTIGLGQGRERDFAYDGDVVYHEYTHGVIDVTAGIVGFVVDRYGVSYEPGAINEGTADYFAATLAGDPELAEYFGGAGPLGGEGSLRVLSDELACPGDLRGEAHLDGRIWGGVLWSIREAIGPDRADAIVFASLSALGDSPTLQLAGEVLVSTAVVLADDGRLLKEDAAAVDAIVRARGLTGCERVVPLDDGEPRMGYSGTEFATGTIGGTVAPVHYRIDVPADAERVTIEVARLTVNGRYTLYVRAGQQPRFMVGRTPPLVADASFPEVATVEIDASSTPALPRCGTLYLALTADDLNEVGQSLYEIRATVTRSGDPDATCPGTGEDAGPPVDSGAADASGEADAGPDAGDRPLGAGGGGCSCRATGGGSASTGALLVLVALGLLARRRRER